MNALGESAVANWFWWLHDARWYEGAAERSGQDVANEINATPGSRMSAQPR